MTSTGSIVSTGGLTKPYAIVEETKLVMQDGKPIEEAWPSERKKQFRLACSEKAS
ncbi:hypothetical protein KW784_00940 [Candidatus Parcubacteria bacterium]|nr:hypothetical protein [Candidatus Parcubacteria bacterium]